MYELQQSGNEMTRTGMPRGAFAVGAIVGAGLALLLAPATGRDVRRRIGHTAQRVGGGARSVIGRAREAVNGVKQDARVSMERGRETFDRTRHGELSRAPAQTG
jgi:gas vesicle protein